MRITSRKLCFFLCFLTWNYKNLRKNKSSFWCDFNAAQWVSVLKYMTWSKINTTMIHLPTEVCLLPDQSRSPWSRTWRRNNSCNRCHRQVRHWPGSSQDDDCSFRNWSSACARSITKWSLILEFLKDFVLTRPAAIIFSASKTLYSHLGHPSSPETLISLSEVCGWKSTWDRDSSNCPGAAATRAGTLPVPPNPYPWGPKFLA